MQKTVLCLDLPRKVCYNPIEQNAPNGQKCKVEGLPVRIERTKYLQEMIDRKHNGLVKVITGIRRCGKSYLLFNLFYDHLIAEGVKDENIIRLELDQTAYIKYRNPFELDKYIRERLNDSDEMHYIFLDEIQFVEKVNNPYVEDGAKITFYDVLNGLMRIKNADVYVTGSNSKMLSTDVLTEFRGRGDEVRVLPLAFSEYMQAYDGDKYDGWLDYYTYGGLPAILERRTDAQKADYLVRLFRETYIRDIVERNQIKNVDDLEDLLDVISSSVGSLTNPSRISNTFKTEKNMQLSKATVEKYIACFEDAFLLEEAKRFDIKGRRYINTPKKYYFTDIGLRNARLNFRQQEENHIMENIIYNELIYRGFSVDVGIVEVREKQPDESLAHKQLEVDFVANKGSRRYYIQSAFEMRSPEKEYQEIRPYIAIADSFKKIVVTKEHIKLRRDDNGIVTMSIYDFLLDPNSLEL